MTIVDRKEGVMEREEMAGGDERALSTTELIAHVTERTRSLLEQEIALAKAEARADVRAEVRAAAGLLVGAVCGICALTLVFAAIAMALGAVMPEWGAALLVAGIVLCIGIIAAAVGWRRRVRTPLRRTRASVKEDLEWASRRIH
jgi:membrane protein